MTVAVDTNIIVGVLEGKTGLANRPPGRLVSRLFEFRRGSGVEHVSGTHLNIGFC